jgi:hypothetical protein
MDGARKIFGPSDYFLSTLTVSQTEYFQAAELFSRCRVCIDDSFRETSSKQTGSGESEARVLAQEKYHDK